MRRLGFIAVSRVFAVGAFALPAAACPTPDQGFRRLATGDAEVAFRMEPAEPKVGQFFTAEIIACGAAQTGAADEIKIDATMPAHGHGMNYRPSAAMTAPGHYRFTGLMLHMPGTWRITIDVLHDGKRSRLTQEMNLRP